MTTLWRIVALPTFLAMSLGAELAWAETGFYLKDGDRVVFYGDSITARRLYCAFVETYVETRFPQLKVSYVLSGWGGDRVTGGEGGPIDVRLQRDVVAYEPTVVTVMVGMNDGEYRAFDQGLFDTFANGYRRLIRIVKDGLPGVRITVMQPSPYDDVTRPPLFEGGYNGVLMRYGAFVKDLATAEKVMVADLNAPVVAALQRAKALDEGAARDIIADRVHPSTGGHLLLSEALLKAWNAPSLVTSVEIDTASKCVAGAENADVTGLACGNAVSWLQTDHALPMPLDTQDATIALALRASDYVSAMDREMLRVHGLTGARYELKIDGEPAGAFTKEALDAGVNLALLPTPMARQAVRVHELTLLHIGVHSSRWREVQLPLANEPMAHLKPALDSMDALEEDLVRERHAEAQPKAHRYELRAQ
jgi:lysophospholipase L1-like esterase